MLSYVSDMLSETVRAAGVLSKFNASNTDASRRCAGAETNAEIEASELIT